MQNIWLPYTQMAKALPPLKVKKTYGSVIKLENGSELIDAISSWWTACHGYNHPYIIEQMQNQMQNVCHIMLGGLVHEVTETLAARLCSFLPKPLQHVFFSDSGSVAVEVALKIAIQYWVNIGKKQKNKFLAFKHAYHGDTLGALSICDPNDGYLGDVFSEVALNNYFHTIPENEEQFAVFEKFLLQHKHELAGVIIEPLVQGAGGMKMHSSIILKNIFELVKANDLIFIVDEVFTGFGRTGSMFAYEQAEITPDIICLSKALTGGVIGLAATVVQENIYQNFLSDEPKKELMHGPTFMGNPLACSAALASLDLFAKQPRISQVASIERTLQLELLPLQSLKIVKEVRVMGAIGVIEFYKIDIEIFKKRALELGVWLRPFDNILYTTPAFTISEQELKIICSAMQLIAYEWEEKEIKFNNYCTA